MFVIVSFFGTFATTLRPIKHSEYSISDKALIGVVDHETKLLFSNIARVVVCVCSLVYSDSVCVIVVKSDYFIKLDKNEANAFAYKGKR